MIYGPMILSFCIGGFIAFIDLITSQYPRTVSFIKGSYHLYCYSLLYAIISLITMIGFWVLVENHILNLDLWICSVLAGIFARPVFHTAIFHAIYHGEAFPIGLETIVRNFDQYFAVGIKLDSFNELSKFVEDSRFQHSTSDHIYEMITNNIPPMEKPERAVVDKDLIDIMKDDGYTNNQKSKTLKLYYLNKFGKKNFIRVFEIQDGDTIR